MRWLGLCVTTAWLLLSTAGCSSSPKAGAWHPTGDALSDGQSAMELGPARDKVLWQYRTSLAALRRGLYDEARRWLDEAIVRLNNIYGPDKDARKSRSYFSEEAKKSFIGEPYERAMAYFYRGVLYWRDGEPDNARACFRSAQLADSDVEDKQYAGDYLLMDYLDGLATAKLGGDGSDALKRAQKSGRLNSSAPYDPKVNLLVFVEYGQGPTKYATGQYGEELRFHPGSSPARDVEIRVGDQMVRTAAWDDLTFQATTRGGRVMDHVLANKAVFKSTTDTVGNVALISGAILATDRHTDEAGLGLVLFGLASKIVSAVTTPKADTRCWDNLPQFLSFTALRVAPGEHKVIVDFVDPQGNRLTQMRKEIPVTITEGGRDAVVFASDRTH